MAKSLLASNICLHHAGLNEIERLMKMSTGCQCVVVTGAGSGIGRAISLNLARIGWKVALVGRRERALAETASLIGDQAIRPELFLCDITDPAAVDAMAHSVLSSFGRVHALVNAAGTNVARRGLTTLAASDFQSVVGTNLYGAYYCSRSFLMEMLAHREGTIVNISSEAGRRATAKAGSAYSISKFGLAGLTQSINAEERENGIRACCIFPGDVATPLLDRRPDPPSAEARQKMLQPEDVADCVRLVLTLPQRAVVEEMVVCPQ